MLNFAFSSKRWKKLLNYALAADARFIQKKEPFFVFWLLDYEDNAGR